MGDNINNQAQISSSGIRGYVQLSDGSGGFTSSSQLSFNPTSNILTGNTGITPSIVGQLAVYNGTTSVAGSAGLTYGLTGRLNVTGDLYVSGNTYATNSVTISGPILQIGANNTVKDTTLGLVYARPTGNIAIAYLTTENGGRYQNTLTIGYTLGSSINPLLQIDTQNLLSVNITGNVTANYFLGNGSQLTSLPAPTVSQDITSNGAMSIMTYDGNLKYVSYATVEPSSGNIAGNNISATGNITGGNISTAGNITGNTNGFTIGYLNIPQIAAANATLALTDAGKHYYSTTAGNFTLTVPTNANVAFATGTAVSIVVQAAGNILVNAASGVTLYMAGNSTSANRVVGGYGMATLMKVASDTWFINGTGVS